MSLSPTFPSSDLSPSSPPPFSSRPSSSPSWSLAPVAGPRGADTPPPCEVPHFPPVRVRGGRYGPLGLVRRRGRALAVSLALAAAALVAAGPRPVTDPPGGGPARGHPARPAGAPPGARDGLGADAGRTVTAPVRIADAETVRLLRPGDRVDVIAAGDPAAGGTARVLAHGARVVRVPRATTGGTDAEVPGGTGRDGSVPDGAVPVGADGALPAGTDGGALIALRVPRATAARLAGASATTRLAVTLW
ncbi:hypothetical protein [Streptomyces sp. Amel2xE9]|uniref:hypothetical protein n=1 Tax=Streptomyces sp. Amel2xE9 TaxID=1157634 RepID=UPI0003A9F666|nr:hypothetical protein [Streptomyces sp. Amel2xE9]